MTNFNIEDMDLATLENMFQIARAKLMRKLNDKILTLETMSSADCCSLSVAKFEELKSDGRLEWNQLSSIMVRITARRKQHELAALAQQTEKNSPNSKAKGS